MTSRMLDDISNSVDSARSSLERLSSDIFVY